MKNYFQYAGNHAVRPYMIAKYNYFPYEYLQQKIILGFTDEYPSGKIETKANISDWINFVSLSFCKCNGW